MKVSSQSEEEKHCKLSQENTKEDSSSLDQSDNSNHLNHGDHPSVASSTATTNTASKTSSAQRRTPRLPKVTTPRRARRSGASSSSDGDESSSSSNEEDDEMKIPSYHNSRAAARNNPRGSSSNGNLSGESTSSTAYQSDPNQANNGNNNASGVSPDQERQILLLMLLAQVCALHDPTPRTFTVHVLELFERGILGRSSIHFLFELGLVPSTAPRLLPPSTTGMEFGGQQILDLTTTTAASSPQDLRSQEASAIRSSLEQHDLAQQAAAATAASLLPTQATTAEGIHNATTALASPAGSPTKPKASSSWAVEHHPLSLSRYQREFHQVRLLNAGSFGEVFQSTSKIDLRDYAVKRVAFSAWGYSKDSVTQVIREVHCLAQCDHPNVVRYYTSWLEPSWMTGSGATMISSTGNSSAEVRHQQKLLTDIQHMMITGGAADHSLEQSQMQSEQSSFTHTNNSDNNGNHIHDFFQGQVASLRERKFSIGSSLDSLSSAGSSYDETSSDDDERHRSYSHPPQEWAAIGGEEDDDDDPIGRTRDDSILFESRRREVWETSSSAPRRTKTQGNATGGNKKQPARLKYRYQICLYIQMQLCHPATLGDWIRNRNQQQSSDPKNDPYRQKRVATAMKIFGQIVSGLNHIHKKNIVHRDLKPANLFRSLEDETVFLIGDFGLSKLIHSATHRKRQPDPVYHTPSEYPDAASTWQDPLTAGVGTASYAANEQVTTRTYGKPADIFSLGLILLELVCCFCTEHERMQTFNDCRNRRDVPTWITKEYPTVASTILACTNADPSKRPTAEQLLKVDLMFIPSTTTVKIQTDDLNASTPNPTMKDEPQSTQALVTSLRQELETKNEQLRVFKENLAERDQTIEELRKELARMKMESNQQVATTTSTSTSSTTHVEYVSTNVTFQEVATTSSGGEEETNAT